jgi:hypothetical protein
MAGKNNKAGRGSGGSITSGPFKRTGAAIDMKPDQRLEGPGVGNTIRSRKARQSRVLGRTLTGSQATVRGLAMTNGFYRKGYGRLDVKRNVGKAKRLNLI